MLNVERTLTASRSSAVTRIGREACDQRGRAAPTMLGGVSRTRATELVRRPGLPEPVDVVGNGRMRIWDRDAVEPWIRANRPHQHVDE
jgi:hypothetical protein